MNLLVALLLLAALALVFVPLGHAQTPAPAAPGKLPEPRTVHIGDIEIAYRELGQGDPLVMIIGYGATMDMWPPKLLQTLAAKRRLIVFDNRGLGLTTSSDRTYSIPLFADDTAGLMDALKIDQAAVFGWSMGSYIAQELALRNPGKVDRLILLSADCGGSEAVPPDPKVLQALNDQSGTPQERGMRMLQQMFPPEWMKAHPDPRTYFPIPREEMDPRNVGRQGEAIGDWTGTCPRLSTLTMPALVMHGTADVIVPPRNAFILAERIPGAWLAQMRDAGHGVMYQYPDDVSAIALTFLDVAR
jgi:pimeloyl-ACP methyl ester carboxylesterase